MTEDEMVGWHHRLNEHEFEQVLGDDDGHQNLVCCSPQGHKESYMNERPNNNKIQEGESCILMPFFSPEEHKARYDVSLILTTSARSC